MDCGEYWMNKYEKGLNCIKILKLAEKR